jgi:hypothetical protein
LFPFVISTTGSIFSQYKGFAAGIAGSTAYAVLRKPKNSIGIMFLAGTVGTLADFTYGWNIGCQDEVLMWQRRSNATGSTSTNTTLPKSSNNHHPEQQ